MDVMTSSQHPVPNARPSLTPSMRKLRNTTEWSMYAMLALAPFGIANYIAHMRVINRWTLIFLGLQVLLAITCAIATHRVVDFLITGAVRKDWPIFVSAALTGGSIVAAVLGFMPSEITASPLNLALVVPMCLLLATIAPLFSTTWNAVFAVGAAGVVAVATFVGHLLHPVEGAAVTTIVLVSSVLNVFLFFFLPASMKTSFTVIKEVASQQRLDQLQADLAVADERLRIARDLHDLFGRTLTAVALKSDLAAELAEAEGAPKAAAESHAVHDLAGNALKEVRAAIAGYREADLAAEVAGAAALLSSAGVAVRVVGAPKDVSSQAAPLLALVVREGATNIVRHSGAKNALMRFTSAPGAESLEMTNDGVRERAESPDGSGLAGLRARIGAAHGTLEWHREGASFALTAFVPIGPTPTGSDPVAPRTSNA